MKIQKRRKENDSEEGIRAIRLGGRGGERGMEGGTEQETRSDVQPEDAKSSSEKIDSIA